jgi:hypothetical protein
MEIEASVTLRIASESCDPGEITTTMGCKPTRSFRKGERMSSHDLESAVRTENLWFLEGTDTSNSIKEQLEQWGRFIVAHREQLSEISKSSELELFCKFVHKDGQGSLLLPATFISTISCVPIAVHLDIYSE